MISCRDFGDLLAYLKNRPEEARLLAEVLGVRQEQEACTWIGMRDAAEWLGKSVSWMKANRGLFPSTFRTEQGGGRYAYKFKKEELRPMYEAFLKRKY
jgi:hypothetical protein